MPSPATVPRTVDRVRERLLDCMSVIRYLQAAAEADRLVVAVNDDRSTTALGAGAADHCGCDRAELVADSRGVDYVTVFSPNVERLLALIKPDAHRGAGQLHDTVERAVVALWRTIAIVGSRQVPFDARSGRRLQHGERSRRGSRSDRRSARSASSVRFRWLRRCAPRPHSHRLAREPAASPIAISSP
jgi:hypothetical protein